MDAIVKQTFKKYTKKFILERCHIATCSGVAFRSASAVLVAAGCIQNKMRLVNMIQSCCKCVSVVENVVKASS